MYRLEFTLKQHTPLIHFQQDQEGATLRATEVKPKLDRFIIERLGNGNYDEGLKKINKDWLNGKKDHYSLDYKLKISCLNQNTDLLLPISGPRLKTNDKGEEIELYDTKNFSMFLSNMGGKESVEDLKNFSFHEKVTLSFLIFNNELKSEIENNIADFLFFTNFGNRQSKGFGSFYIHPDDKHFKKPSSKFSFGSYYAKNQSLEIKFQTLFNEIDLFYRTIRGGINQKKKLNNISTKVIDKLTSENRLHIGSDKNQYEEILYFKSLLFLYAKDIASSQWEKKTIKEIFFPLSNITRRDGSRIYLPYRLDDQQTIRSGLQNKNEFPLFFKSNSKYLFKDLLGLSTEESWLSYNRDIISKKQARNTHTGFEAIPEKDQTINRYTSPLLIKPIDDGSKYTIYLINKEPRELKNKIQGNYFMISNKKGKPFPLQVYPGFDLGLYLDFIFDSTKWNIDTHVENKFHNSEQFKILKRIYSEIQK